jgi:fucose 4-O-acetylase-like acetyltransferase
MVNRSTASRFEAIDYAKGVGIVLVVFGHVWRGLHSANIWIDPKLYGLLDRWVYSFHMPLFFFISGLFIARSAQKPAGKFLSDKLATIAWPYLIWSILQALAQVVAGGTTNSNGITIRELPRALAIDPYAQFWFLYVLFLCSVAFLVLHKLRVPAIAIFALSIALYVCSRIFGLGDWGVLYQAARSLLYFTLGAVCAGFVLQKLPNLRPLPLLLVAAVSGVVLTVVIRANPRGIDDAFWRVFACVGIAMTLCLAAVLAVLRVPVIDLLGRCTLQIYVAHIIAASGARIVLQKFFHVHGLRPHLVAGMLAGVIVPMVLAWIVQKYNIPGVFVGPWRSRAPGPARRERRVADEPEPALA